MKLRRTKRTRGRTKNNRINYIKAIIFLLAGLVFLKLFTLQVINNDFFLALASDQHSVLSILAPERGKIYIQDRESNQETTKLFAVATNKDFALVYAKPEEVIDKENTAEGLFEIFDYSTVEEEVDEVLSNDEYFKDLYEKDNPSILASSDKQREEFRLIKRDLEIELRKKSIVEEYITKLSKANDPYEPIKSKVNEETLNKLLAMELTGINYLMERHRFYPENNIGSHILGFVGFKDDTKKGLYGLEGFFDIELAGEYGRVKADRDARGDVIIINEREYDKPRDGSELVLTIERSIQYTACQKLNETALRHGADSGSIIVMDPNTGAILAMCSWPDYDPNNYSEVEEITVYNNPAIFSQYEPGSIFKSITLAAALDLEEVAPDTKYSDEGYVYIEGWPKPIKNSDYESHGGYGRVDMNKVLEESLNTGAIFAMQKIGAEAFAGYVKEFGFGEKTGVELETETNGDITSLTRKTIRPVEAATATFGQGITATPLQMAVAYSAIANGGILMKPYIVKEIRHTDTESTITQPRQIKRVISERTSILLSGMLVNVIDGGHAKRAAVDGYYLAGKTGTAQVPDKEKRGYSDRTIHTFIGYGPVEEPRFVILVRLDDPKGIRFAASSAAPLFSEIAQFMLQYLEIPKER